jgi:tryptophan synthase alpha chain
MLLNNGTQKLSSAFTELNTNDEVAFIPFIPAGDPELSVTNELITQASQHGADMIELGIPSKLSNGADSEIKLSYEHSLQQNISLDEYLDSLSKTINACSIPVFISVYKQSLDLNNYEYWAQKLASSGISGILIPDLPANFVEQWSNISHAKGLATIFLIAPMQYDYYQKLQYVQNYCSGFLYYLAYSGVREMQAPLPEDLIERIAILKSNSRVPVVVGYGITNPFQVAQIACYSDGVLARSIIAKTIDENAAQFSKYDKIIKNTCSLIKKLCIPCHRLKV